MDNAVQSPLKIRASYHQERLWFIDTFETGNIYESNPVYHNIPLIVEIKGTPALHLLEQSLKTLIQRHEALRTRMTFEEDRLYQQVEPGLELKLPIVDLCAVDERKKPGQDPLTSAIHETSQPFSLTGEPLTRTVLIKVSSDRSILVITLHHIIADRYSLKTIYHELVSIYRDLSKEPTPLEEVPLHYADFSNWQREISPDALEAMRFYWNRQLAGLKPLDLPTDRPRAPIHIYRGGRILFQLNSECSNRIKEFCRQKGTGNDVLLLAGFNILLGRYCGQEDIVVGISIDNRHQPETEGIVGPVANLLVIRTGIPKTSLFPEYYSHLCQTLEQAYENRDIPFDWLAEQLNPGKDISRTVFFDVLFQYDGEPPRETSLGSLTFNYIETNLGWGKYDLNLLIRDNGKTFTGILVYNAEYYDESTVARLSSHYKVLLESILENPHRQISRLALLTPGEKQRFLNEWNQSTVNYPKDRTIIEIFETQAESAPDRTALLGEKLSITNNQLPNTDYKPGETRWADVGAFGGLATPAYNGEAVSITYKELNRKAGRLAHGLKEKAVGADTIVGIMVVRSIETIVSILGILKAGGAYLPIDPESPGDRIRYMLADSGAKILITKGSKADPVGAVRERPLQLINLEEVLSISTSSLTSTSTCQVGPANLAYIIYTSGTTGRPKGVMIEHSNLMGLFLHERFPFDFNSSDVWTMFHSICFDFSVWEVWGALLYGGKLLVVPKISARNTSQFATLLRTHSVTVLNQTPSAFYNLITQELAAEDPGMSLRYVIFGGEALNPGKLSKWKERYPQVRLINMYGITETTIHVTYKEITDKEIRENLGNIGKPLSALNAYVLDEQQEFQPLGVHGELYITGLGVARGYLNQPGLTAERFMDNPHKPGERLYRSGDLARKLENHELIYAGRVDKQVQLRGFRIELGEIETRLLACPGVEEAVVLGRRDETGDLYLCAYIVGDKAPGPAETRQMLGRALPEYMIPAYVVKIDAIPLTPNGKVDRKALPAPGAGSTAAEYVPPQDSVQQKMADIWAKVLNIEPQHIGIDTSFFDMGGHSLKATIMTARVHQQFQVKIPMAQVFITPTIRALSGFIRTTGKKSYISIKPAEEKEYYELSPAQKRLYILQQLVTDNTSYNMPYIIPLEQSVEKEKLESIFKKLIERHESLRTSFITVNEEPVQRIHRQIDFSIDCYEIKEEAEDDSLISGFTKPFNLDTAHLLRVYLIAVGSSHRRVLFIDLHHIITDGTSQAILEKEFLALQEKEELPPLRLQYKDYSVWNNSVIQQEAIKQQESYWINEFSGEIPVLNLPIDYSRPSIQSIEGNVVSFSFNCKETGNVKSIAAENNSTLYMCLLAVFNVLLSKLSGQEDIIIGTPIAARRHTDLQNVIGMLVNTLAMRNYPSGDKPFREFLKEVNQRTLDAYENQEYPFEVLVDNIIVHRDASRNPVFDVMLNLLSQWTSTGENPGIKDQPPYQHQKGTSRFDMTFSAVERGERIGFGLEYSTRLFTPSTIERFIRYLKTIVFSLPQSMEQKLSQIEFIPTEEKQEILQLGNGFEERYDTGETICQLFEEQVEKRPNHIALVSMGQNTRGILRNVHLTYKELNRESNQLAHLLREKGVGPNSVVGLMVERSIEMIIGVLAVIKAGGAYLPIDPLYPQQRIETMLNDSEVIVLLTRPKELVSFSITGLKNMKARNENIVVTPAQDQITNFDRLPIPDRTLIDYKKYHQYIGEAPAKHTINLQATRGCPYHCLYCHKIWPKKHVTRSAENIFREISYTYEAGIRRFVFIDDIFNLDQKNAARFLETIIKSKMDIQLFFPNGFRADILSRDFIDLMAAAGTVNLDVALESASPRIQKLIRKNLNLEKFKENVQYITETYPQIILEMKLMLGFPTESQEEAMMTLDFLESLKWVHFPNLHILKIFPNTDICTLALENGISKEAIERSANLAFHELPDTLPFSKSFTRQLQAKFMGEYFLSKKRLLHVLPFQMKILSEDELIQKYDSYLSSEIKHFDDILRYTGISREELGNGDGQLMQEEQYQAPDFVQKISKYFPVKTNPPPESAFRILLLDLSQLFSESHEYMLHHQIEEPLGLLYLMTYLNETFKDRIYGKIFKSRIDFDSYEELETIIFDFKPDLIGIRTLSFYKDFFHKAVLMIRQWGMDVPIVAGGPYATSDYHLILQDPHVDVVVLGEGEFSLAHLVEKIMENNNQLPGEEVLKNLRGIAFRSRKNQLNIEEKTRNILLPDEIPGRSNRYPTANPEPINQTDDLLYVIYTSGSTGTPKGVMLEHGNLLNLIRYQYNHTDIDFSRVLQFTSIGFDVSAQEIFSTLLAGGVLSLVSREMLSDVPELFKKVKNDYIKTLFLPTSFLKFVMNEKDFLRLLPASVKHIVTAGEQMIVNERFKRYLKENDVYFHNHYGPSETHVVTAFTVIPGGDAAKLPPIGRPVLNTSIYLLDKGHQPVPVGVTGELFIGGIQVGRGYLNNPELTAEKFERAVNSHSLLVISSSKKLSKSTNDQCSMTNDRFYRTGDLARWLADSNIEFLGRIDHQVKIRGFRVEIGEIENRLLNYPGIKEAVVMASGEEDGDKYLCAYVVANGENVMPKLRGYLSKELPDYMLPSYFVRLEKIPLTPNRKIDWKSMPKPELKVGESYTAPGNEIEKKLVELWSETLGRDPSHVSQLQTSIGIDDNFFELGGHSLKATILISKIHKVFDVKVPLVEIFKRPRIKELAKYIKGKSKDNYISIEPVEEKEYYPLSSAQKRLYILQQMNLDNTTYNMPEIIPLPAEFDLGKIDETFKRMIKRHESLRTSFHMINDMPVQVVHDEVEFEIEYYQVKVKVEEERSSLLEETKEFAPLSLEPATRNPQPVTDIIRSFIRPFNLSNAPLLRASLVNNINGNNILLVDMHHIISDGVSHEILVNDFLALYKEKELLPLRVQYKDFSQWQNGEKEKENIKRQEEYWLKEFEGEIPALELPTDYPRPVEQSFEGNSVNFEMTEEETNGLKSMALSGGSTLFMVLMSAVNILLSKLSGQEDIVVGTPIAGRRHADLERIIGMFVNTLSLRNYTAGDRIFREFLGDVKEKVLMVFENQEYPFEELVDKLSVKRDIGRNPLFDIMFVLQNQDTGSAGQEKETEYETSRSVQPHFPKGYENIVQTAKFDLKLTAVEKDRGLFCSFQYCTKLFKKETIEQFIIYFNKIISIVMKEPEMKLSEIDIISDEEKKQILKDFNKTEAVYPKDKTIHQLFEEQVERTPDHVAIIGSPVQMIHESPLKVSYRELNEKSNRLARLLQIKGIDADTTEAIMIEPCIEMIVGILAVLKCGSCYLPIDPMNPEGRIEYLLTDSKAKLLLTHPPLAGKVSVGIEILDIADELRYTGEAREAIQIVKPGDSVYMIYTSGTTGNPKGVQVKHENLVNYINWFSTETHLTADDKTSLTSSFAFDLGYSSIYPSLLNGAQLHLLSKEIYMEPGKILNYIRWQGITYLKMTPSLFSTIVMHQDFSADTCHGLRLVVLGGEAINTSDVERAYRICTHLRVMNHYGPTETTIGCIAQFIERGDWEAYKITPTIGRPIFNTQVYILDKYLNLVPVGIVGEICISGAGLAKGYFKKDELTGEKFVKIEKIGNTRVYRTGDLGRWLSNGNIEFLGRIDHQVKIRGFRVELGEIENHLKKLPRIKEAVLVAREEQESGGKYLCAYIVSDRDSEYKAAGIREFLLKELPDYMIPSYFVRLEKIPLTPNGKVDRKALPKPEVKAEQHYLAPRNGMEMKLVGLWAEVLNIQPNLISIDRNFFELGGHSLKATTLASKIHKELNIILPLVEIFKSPTIMKLGEFIINTTTNIQKNICWNLVLLKEGPSKDKYLFFIHDGSGEVEGYVEFCKRITNDFNCWGLRADRLESLAPRNVTIRELAETYIHTMKKIQPHGPYYTAGWSLGGTIAFEMTLQLEKIGEEVSFLGLIDAPGPQQNWVEEANPFSLESELNWVWEYLRDNECKEKVREASDISEIWNIILDHLDKNHFNVEFIKRLIPAHLARIIPNYNQLGIKELIYYLNLNRTLSNARSFYIPSQKIHTTLHYFKASESSAVFQDRWCDYCMKPIISYEIPGDHFTVFKEPNGVQSAGIIERVLDKCYN